MCPNPEDVRITLSKEGVSEYEIKKSVFIGKAIRVSSSKQAEEFVASVRSQYPDARHVAYAWMVSGAVSMQKFSDDGEPSGTAGKPIISILERMHLENSVVTVTRYFGGILLGTGGLVHAYTKAAVDAIAAASPVRIQSGVRYELICDYSQSDKLIYLLNNSECKIKDVSYNENVKIIYECAFSQEDSLSTAIINASSARVIPTKLCECDIVGVSIEPDLLNMQ